MGPTVLSNKRILIVSCLYPPYSVGGAENTVRKLAQGLVELGHTVRVIATVPDNEVRKDRDGRVEVNFVSNHNSYWPFDGKPHSFLSKIFWHMRDIKNARHGRYLDEQIKEFKPDVVQTHNLTGFSPAIWDAAKQAGVPIVHFLHDYGLLCSRTALFHKNKSCGGPASLNEIDPTQRCRSCILLTTGKTERSQQVDAVVGVSQAVLDLHLKSGMFKNARIKRVILNSLSPQALAEQLMPKAKQPDILSIGFIGAVKPEKGIEYLLRSLQHLPKGKWRAVIGGRGAEDYVEHLKATYPLAEVSYLGQCQQQEFYPQIDLLVVPSVWREPLGNVVMEAYSYGIPVIAAKRGGIPEMIDEGQTGMLFEPENEGELTEQLMQFIDDPEKTTQFLAPIQHKVGYFTVARQMEQYTEVLQELLDQSDVRRPDFQSTVDGIAGNVL